MDDLRLKLKDPHRLSHHKSHKYHQGKGDGYFNVFDPPRSRYDLQTPGEREEELQKVSLGNQTASSVQ